MKIYNIKRTVFFVLLSLIIVVLSNFSSATILGDLTVTANTGSLQDGVDYRYIVNTDKPNIIEIISNKAITISGVSNKEQILIKNDANITIENLNIDMFQLNKPEDNNSKRYPPIVIERGTTNLTLKGNNILKQTGYSTSLKVNENSSIIIGGKGKLVAYTSGHGSGIGSGMLEYAGNITINDGIIEIKHFPGNESNGTFGSIYSTGIGAGDFMTAATFGNLPTRKTVQSITINGGKITGQSDFAPVIGGGSAGIIGPIKITGGVIEAYLTSIDSTSSVIGSGQVGEFESIDISGGSILARGTFYIGRYDTNPRAHGIGRSGNSYENIYTGNTAPILNITGMPSIFTSSIFSDEYVGNLKNPRDYTKNQKRKDWTGYIFEGNSGLIYPETKQNNFNLPNDFEIPYFDADVYGNSWTLHIPGPNQTTIKSYVAKDRSPSINLDLVVHDKVVRKLTIPKGITLKNDGLIEVHEGGVIVNNGTLTEARYNLNDKGIINKGVISSNHRITSKTIKSYKRYKDNPRWYRPPEIEFLILDKDKNDAKITGNRFGYIKYDETLNHFKDYIPSAISTGTKELKPGWYQVINGVVQENEFDSTKQILENIQLTVRFKEKSVSPVIDAIVVGDKTITGTGINASTVKVTFPNGTTKDVVVDQNNKWSVVVDEGITLTVNDTIKATQTEIGKSVSDEATKKPIEKSVSPVIDTIVVGDKTITGTGINASTVKVTFPNGTTKDVVVEQNNKWSVVVDESITLTVNDTIKATQTEIGKSVSDEATKKPIENKRISGKDRFETATEISKERFDTSDTVIIVNGFRFTDGLTSTVLSDLKNAPILLVRQDFIPKVTLNEISRLGASNIIIIGGPHAVSENISNYFKKDKNVERLGGVDRFETAEKVADSIIAITNNSTKIVMSRGDIFPDALTISSLAIKEKAPILLTWPKKLTKSTHEYILRIKPTEAYIAGQTTAVSNSVKTKIDALVNKTIRIGGLDRYETATKIASYTYPKANISLFASGEKFIDAMISGPLTNKIKAPILLVKKNSVTKYTTRYLKEQEGKLIKSVYIVGGVDVISTVVEDLLKEIVK